MNTDEMKTKLNELWTKVDSAFKTVRDSELNANAVRCAEALKDNLQTVLDFADTNIDKDYTATVCGVASALWQAFGDETRLTREAVSRWRGEVFGSFEDFDKYVKELLTGLNYREAWVPCSRCKQKYKVFTPATKVFDEYLKSHKQEFRRFNSNSVMELVYFSGLCDACWQEAHNRG